MTEQRSTADEHDELLVQALLDGELSAEDAQALRVRIAREPRLKAIELELQALIGDCTYLFAGVESSTPAPRVETPSAGVIPFRAANRVAPPLRAWHASSMLRAAVVLLLAGGAAMGGRAIGARFRGDAASHVAAAHTNDAAPPRATSAVTPLATTPRANDHRVAAVPRFDAGAATSVERLPSTTRVQVSAAGLTRVAAREDAAGAAGTLTYAVGGSRVTLEYGAAAVAGGGRVVEGPLATPLPSAGGSAQVPSGVSTLRTPGQAGDVSSAPRCPEGIRWRDASGVELRLAGAGSCDDLRRLAARFRISVTPTR